MLLKIKLCSKNLIKGIDTWIVPLVRSSGPFLKWTREELEQIDQRTKKNKKLMTIHKAIYTREDIDRLYVSRKKGGRGLTSIEDSVDAPIKRLEDYMEKRRDCLITATRNDTNHTMTNNENNKKAKKWEEKQIYGRFKRLISNLSYEKTWK